MLRPTRSSSLWVQMLGRGMRVSHGKANCLVLDFASNTSRLGPVDDPEIPGRPRPGPPGDAPVKICPTCSTYNYSSARYCTHCGHEFPTTEKLSANASDAPLMSSDLAVITTFKVDSVNYVDHMSRAGNRSIRAMYHCGLRVFSEYVAIGGDKWAGHKAKTWWMQRHHSDPPASVDDALMLCSELRAPKAIRVWVNTQYPEILSYQWEDYNGEG
jgi:DNA repair protein RadD